MLLPPTHGAGKQLGSGECKNRAGLKVLSFVGSHIPQDATEPGNVCTHLWVPVPEGFLGSHQMVWPRIREQQGPLSHMPAALQPALCS